MRDDEKKLLAHTIEKRINRLQIILQQGELKDMETDQAQETSADSGRPADREVDDTLLEHARMELQTLSRNLDWLQQDNAGVCEECGKDILLQRLLAVPNTRLCIDCAVETA